MTTTVIGDEQNLKILRFLSVFICVHPWLIPFLSVAHPGRVDVQT